MKFNLIYTTCPRIISLFRYTYLIFGLIKLSSIQLVLINLKG